MKRMLKRFIFKPAFSALYKIAPKAAVDIRGAIYGFIRRDAFRHYKLKESDGKPRLLVDVTYMVDGDTYGGISNVVQSISKELIMNYSTCLEFTQFLSKKVITANRYTAQLASKPKPMVRIMEDQQLSYNNGDMLLLLAPSWDSTKYARNAIKQIHEHNGRVYGIIYDLFPIKYPELFDSRSFIDCFTIWHNMMLERCDGVICISKTVAEGVFEYYKTSGIKRSTPFKIFSFHLGADFNRVNSSKPVRVKITDFVKDSECFLMVGTLEPRKGHIVALKAIEELITQGLNIKLLILGHNGWKNEKIKEALKNLPAQAKARVLWISDASDEEVCYAYRNATALIAASKDEGCGLPLVEAGHFGLPIICSDIPIFREVTENNATFFKPMDSGDLSCVISKWLESENHPDSSKIRIYSWNEAAKEILDIIAGKRKPLYEV